MIRYDAMDDAMDCNGRGKKGLGTYYTSLELASVLTDWCLDSRCSPTALDPTFGGCAFLHAALERLAVLGVERPGDNVFGVDVDPRAMDHARRLLDLGVPRKNLVRGDFLTVRPDRFGRRVDAVIGNPPYVRHHRLSAETIERGQSCVADAGLDVPRTADLWAYVLVHSLRFLRVGGRMALLLPGAVLQANYARPVVDALASRFAQIELVLIRERAFADASERTVALFADGFGDGPTTPSVQRVENVRDLACFAHGARTAAGPAAISRRLDSAVPRALARNRAERKAARIFQACIDEASDPLSAVGSVRIGTVTGANSFFVRRPSEITKANVPEDATRPVVSRTAWLATPVWRTADQERLDASDDRTRLLVLGSTTALSPAVTRWIEDAEANHVDKRHHCSRRSPWYQLIEPGYPDALLPYMGVNPPRLVSNVARVATTNAIHAVSWTSKSAGPRAVLSSWTTLFALAVEIFGRSYGKGILKLEPSDASRMPVVRLKSSAGLGSVDRRARSGGRQEGIALADRLVLTDGVGLSLGDLELLREWQQSLQSFRVRRN